ncbi:M48 family metalloprotease [Oscillochloris sp. ZM17-4]|uniref:M48 family metalloprotease n=1 Tax=Oscillochloris sp. ZM17-4 TaxID=2866714 RepID=UPI001C73DBCD|nr:M48 family metalloprotease [Oscillochloris sp. ZM17-4]MBX0329249.1 M48 family metalloprotease [Oscillochloris sp. ZM17-4]
MAGVVLYIFTLLIESISVVVRFGIVSGLVRLLAGGTAGIVAGAVAGLGPVIYSLLAQVRARGVPFPRHVFAVDIEGLNAAISGRTMYIYRELFDSRYLTGVVAHELGHFNSMDGRLMLGIRALTIPGGFFIAYLLLGLLRWVAYGISTVLVAFLVVVFAFLRINLSGLAGPLFGISLQITRMTIIFAVGGVGPALLGSIWRSYFIEREFAADAFAGRLGYAYDLLDFFETEVLSDVSIPWYEQPTHPTTTRRVVNLEQVAASFPQARARPQGARRPPPSPAPERSAPTGAQPSAAARPQARDLRAARSARRPWPIIAGVGLLAAAILIVALLSGAPPARPADAYRPTPGPTPTLGISLSH